MLIKRFFRTLLILIYNNCFFRFFLRIMTHSLFLIFLSGIVQFAEAQTDSEKIVILKTQISFVQRALIDYLRINSNFLWHSPTMSDLISQNYLPVSNDIGYRYGAFHLYTLWQGEITVSANRYFYFIQVAELPRYICYALLVDLKHTSPLSLCQGDVGDPMDWVLRIPLNEIRVFNEEDFEQAFKKGMEATYK